MDTIENNDSLINITCNPSWIKKEEGITDFFIRYYTYPFIDNKNLTLPFKPGEEISFLGTPFRLNFVYIKDQKFKTSHLWPIKNQQDEVGFYVEDVEQTLPPTNYILVSCPLSNKESKGISECIRKTDQFIGLLRTICGNGLFREIARQATVNYSTGRMTSPSRTIRPPKPCEGIYINETHWLSCFQLLNKVENSPVKDRLLQSLTIFERAAQSTNPTNFFLYWVSIEVLCDSHNAHKIAEILSNAYKQSTGEIKQNLGLKHLIRLRQDVFHSGKEVKLGVDAEKYIQVLFLDLLNQILDIPCENHIQNYINSGYETETLITAGKRGIFATILMKDDNISIEYEK